MNFPNRLSQLRKLRGLTQQALSDQIELHVNQIKRYEAGTAQPTLETLIRLAKALHVTLDELVFNEDERGPGEDFRMQFEALRQFNEREKLVAKELLDSLILKHTANQLTAGGTG
jgi:transcriptional regulator with XRE-family HTH domain